MSSDLIGMLDQDDEEASLHIGFGTGDGDICLFRYLFDFHPLGAKS